MNNKKTGANAVGHKNVLSAIATAIYDQFSKKGLIEGLGDNVRVDGKTCFITGANSGLGKAVAIEMARRGAHVIMACRSGVPEAGEDVKQASGSALVEMLKVDLSDMHSVVAMCDALRDKKIKLDIVILNAGLMPLNARKTEQGYEVMFAVHFLANRLLLGRFAADGVLQTDSEIPPRVIFVASEAHQSSDPIDFDNFAAFQDYGIKDGMKYYGYSKLHMLTLAKGFYQKMNPAGENAVYVSALCPGPIASNIAREAPSYLKPLLNPIMKLFFNSPQVAAEPVVFLACTTEPEIYQDAYLHMMREKSPSPHAQEAENIEQLWQKSAALLNAFLPAEIKR